MTSARAELQTLQGRFPIVITRGLDEVRVWLRTKARGSERYGILCPSQAYRLKPHAIDVHAKIDPVPWFLNGKDDVRSSYALEDAATEFKVQGLELGVRDLDADSGRGPRAGSTSRLSGVPGSALTCHSGRCT